jgi:cytochrome c oxidase assembly protein Cox11
VQHSLVVYPFRVQKIARPNHVTPSATKERKNYMTPLSKFPVAQPNHSGPRAPIVAQKQKPKRAKALGDARLFPNPLAPLWSSATAVSLSGLRHASVPSHQLHCQSPVSAGVLTHPDQELLQLKHQTERSQPTTYSHADTSQRDTSPRTSKPTPHKIKVHPGDTAPTSHIAQNETNEAKSGIPVHHTNPQKVGIHSNKTQCPRPEEQRPKASESIETPIPPSTDPDLEEDPKTRDVDPTTPSHTPPESHQRNVF